MIQHPWASRRDRGLGHFHHERFSRSVMPEFESGYGVWSL